MENTIAILLPGTTGSTLVAPGQPYDDSDPVWSNQVKEALKRLDRNGALKLLEGQLYAGIPGRGYDGFAGYFEGLNFQYVAAQTPQQPLPLVKTSVNSWGLPSSLDGDLLIGFAYDWRQDNTTSAKTLANLLYNVERLYGGSYQQLYLIAHSMGGLVSRTYLETGISQGDSWLGKIKALITLGTPHLGAPLAVDAVIGKLPLAHDMFLLDWLASNLLASNQYSASTYELLPPPQEKFINVNAAGKPKAQYSIFDPSLPQEVTKYLQANGLNPAYLERARQFFSTLNYNGSGSLPPYYCVYGLTGTAKSDLDVNVKTVVSCEYSPATRTTKESWQSNMVAGAGDEIVPKESARFDGRQVAVSGTYEAKGVNHMKLADDPGVQQQVARWMNLITRPSREPFTGTLTVGTGVAAQP